SRQRRVALEDRLIGIAEDRLYVIPGPDVVVAEPFRRLCCGEERRPVAGLAPERDPELEIGHLRPSGCCAIECMHPIAPMIECHKPGVPERRSKTGRPLLGRL